MAAAAAASPSSAGNSLFDGRTGTRAPFKADYVSSLVAAVLDAEINQILRLKALQDQQPTDTPTKSVVNTLVNALKAQRKDGTFPIEQFGDRADPSELKIGIIGAGMAGLYSAYILDKLNIDYEILEANPKRLGGRIYTHQFSTASHDYYDIGAMRFPDSPIMARTFDLFKRLNIGEPGKSRQKDNCLIPYYMVGRNCPTRYNDISANLGRSEKKRNPDGTVNEKDVAARPSTATKDIDPFKVSTTNGGTVPASRVSSEVCSEILSDAYDRFRQKIKAAHILTVKAQASGNSVDIKSAKEARQRAYEYLMRHDKFSLREYLQNVEGYDPETCHWLETIDSASGWYDMAFTENVFESLAFCYSDAENSQKDNEETPTQWWCIEGGSQELVERFKKDLSEKRIHKGKVVTRMALEATDGDEDSKNHSISVSTRDHPEINKEDGTPGKEETRHYSAVINTTTLGALQKIDLTDMELPYGMKSAIRILRYDTSTKVGIKFKKMWWMHKDFDITLGGVAKTDLPIRVCVYPSYNIDDPPENGGVLLASYTWGQDSERIASHVSSSSPVGDKGLKELMIYNLARLHTLTRPGESAQDREARFQKNKTTIHNAWDTHHAYDWSKDEFSSGAFALFSPGQFSTLIPHLVRPASDGRFVIVGEHASANHAWIVGALDSALRGLKQIFTRLGLDGKDGKLEQMIKMFGDVDELDNELVAKQVILSMLTEEEMSKLRLGRPVAVVGKVAQV